MLSYDEAQEINSIYNNTPHLLLTLPYSINKGSIKGNELMIFNNITIEV